MSFLVLDAEATPGRRSGAGSAAGLILRTKTRASVMVSGVLAERAPRSIKAIVSGGHEIVAHAYAQEVIPAALSPEQDVADIAKTTALLTEAAGVKPKGWISPRGTPGRDSARHLLAAGYVWQGDVFDDDRPYVQDFAEGRLVAIPLTMEINDLPHAMRFGRSARQFVENFDDLLTNALISEDEAVMIDVTAHTHCYGRPSGAWAYEEVARKASARDDIYVGTRDAIASHVLTSVG